MCSFVSVHVVSYYEYPSVAPLYGIRSCSRSASVLEDPQYSNRNFTVDQNKQIKSCTPINKAFVSLNVLFQGRESTVLLSGSARVSTRQYPRQFGPWVFSCTTSCVATYHSRQTRRSFERVSNIDARCQQVWKYLLSDDRVLIELKYSQVGFKSITSSTTIGLYRHVQTADQPTYLDLGWSVITALRPPLRFPACFHQFPISIPSSFCILPYRQDSGRYSKPVAVTVMCI